MNSYVVLLGVGALLLAGHGKKTGASAKTTAKGKTVKASAKVKASSPSVHYASVDGKRILLIGDSLSMVANSPGGRLAQRLRDSGAKVLVNATGGRSAGSFLSKKGNCDSNGCDGGHGADQLAKALASFNPDVALIMLGTNDLCNVAAGGGEKFQLDSFAKIIGQMEDAGVKVIGIGPPMFPASDQPHKFKRGKPPVVYAKGDLIATGKTFIPKLAAKYKPGQFIDSRDLTVDLATMANRKDGIHFTSGGDVWAARLAEAVAARI